MGREREEARTGGIAQMSSEDSNWNRAQSSNPVHREREDEPRTGGIAQMSSNSNQNRAQSSSKPVRGDKGLLNSTLQASHA